MSENALYYSESSFLTSITAKPWIQHMICATFIDLQRVQRYKGLDFIVYIKYCITLFRGLHLTGNGHVC